jgi:hypothetical protein
VKDWAGSLAMGEMYRSTTGDPLAAIVRRTVTKTSPAVTGGRVRDATRGVSLGALISQDEPIRGY